MLKARQQACKEINRIYGTNISVKRRKLEEIPEYEFINKNEGEE